MNGQLEIKRLTPPPEEIDMTVFDDAMMLTYIIGVLAIVWFVIYLFSLFKLNQTLAKEGEKTWQNAGKPTLFKTNLKFYKFVFGQAINSCSKTVKNWGRLFRLLTFLGVFIIGSAIYAYVQLMNIY